MHPLFYNTAGRVSKERFEDSLKELSLKRGTCR